MHTSQGTPTPNLDNILSLMPGAILETSARSATTNHHLLKVSHEFTLCDKPKKLFGKQKKAFAIKIMLHLHPNMHRLNSNDPQHKEFLDATQFFSSCDPLLLEHYPITMQPVSESYSI